MVSVLTKNAAAFSKRTSLKKKRKHKTPNLTSNQSVLRQVLAFVPLILVGVTNKLFITSISHSGTQMDLILKR